MGKKVCRLLLVVCVFAVGSAVTSAGFDGPPHRAQGLQGPAGGVTAGGLKGQLTSCSGNVFAGYLVHVPGRAFSVFTGADGVFQIDNMPAGIYGLSIEHSGAVQATLTNISVTTTVADTGSFSFSNVSSDPNNCGACGISCGGGTCQGGVCIAGPPPPTCPNNCSGRGLCQVSGGTSFCQCNAGFGGVDCSLNLMTDVNNCGTPGRVCSFPNSNPSCVNGSCNLLCHQSFADCNGIDADGCESNTNTDPNNCGGCGIVCGAGLACRLSVCR